ncbi:transmembrane protein 41A-like [Paramacrobiotus metropolitanus]|uniref:transmembrane protein 41A-like n=1 Tax=Paramacrobiotus metropolitanus TaxID=2943436 RepID=UPI002445E7A8|nr:transmembrane protein 41A-like [Paramacrobiotus metropolitanus]
MASAIFLPVLFIVCTYGVYYLAVSAPSMESGERLDLHFPKSFEDLKNTTTLLYEYKEQHHLYVLMLFCAAFLWKQSFGIPGSASLNIASGALFGFWMGFPLSCLLTAVGATNCYILSYLFGHKLVIRFFSAKLAWLRSMIHSNSQQLMYYLLFLRLFPASPNWFLNIASPHLGIPIHKFFAAIFFGLMPYNFICVHSGSILRDLNSFNEIFTWSRIAQLVLIASVALIPGIYLKKSQRSAPNTTAVQNSNVTENVDTQQTRR